MPTGTAKLRDGKRGNSSCRTRSCILEEGMVIEGRSRGRRVKGAIRMAGAAANAIFVWACGMLGRETSSDSCLRFNLPPKGPSPSSAALGWLGWSSSSQWIVPLLDHRNRHRVNKPPKNCRLRNLPSPKPSQLPEWSDTPRRILDKHGTVHPSSSSGPTLRTSPKWSSAWDSPGLTNHSKQPPRFPLSPSQLSEAAAPWGNYCFPGKKKAAARRNHQFPFLNSHPQNQTHVLTCVTRTRPGIPSVRLPKSRVSQAPLRAISPRQSPPPILRSRVATPHINPRVLHNGVGSSCDHLPPEPCRFRQHHVSD